MNKNNKKKFVFINLTVKSGYNSGVNHGIAYLVPIVKKYSYEPYVINLRTEIRVEEFIKKVDMLNPEIIGFSSVSNQLIYLIKYSNALRGREILQLAGGVGPTLSPEEVLFRTGVQGVCIGEGETPLDNLLNNITHGKDVFHTEGFYWNINNKIKKNPIPQFIADLSTLDFPDYTVFEDYIVSNRGLLLIMLSRGCPFNCNYCCNKVLGGVYPSFKNYLRAYSVESSLKLLEKMIKRYTKTELILFQDDLLIANQPWFENFSKEYLKRINIPYHCLGRVEYINTDITKLLKVSGCLRMSIGLESGNEYLRNNLLNRKYSNDFFIKRARMIKDAGIELYTYNIVGFPFETKEQMEDTLQLNKEIESDDGVCTFFYPYKGTALYNICEQEGLLKDTRDMISLTNYNTRPAIKLTATTDKECISYQKKITSYLVSQSMKFMYKRFCASNFGFKKYYYLVYLWTVLYIKPYLRRLLYNSDYLFVHFSKMKRYIYLKKTKNNLKS